LPLAKHAPSETERINLSIPLLLSAKNPKSFPKIRFLVNLTLVSEITSQKGHRTFLCKAKKVYIQSAETVVQYLSVQRGSILLQLITGKMDRLFADPFFFLPLSSANFDFGENGLRE
jgi:hypothetical protein